MIILIKMASDVLLAIYGLSTVIITLLLLCDGGIELLTLFCIVRQPFRVPVAQCFIRKLLPLRM
jgi:hypothetical protein